MSKTEKLRHPIFKYPLPYFRIFECKLKPEDLLKLKFYLKKLINKKEDRIHFYRLCLGCYGKIERIGTDRPITDEETIVI